MNALFLRGTIFWRPALLSVLLHVLVVAAMTVNWSARRESTPAVKVQPRYIEARLVDASVLKPKKKKRTSAPPKQPVVTKKPAPAKTVTAAKPAPRPRAETKPRPAPVPAPETGPSPAERSALAREELALALDAEDVLLEQASDEQLARGYIALITQTVQNNWSRPPSARNGMETELVIQLIPTGEVVSVTVARSSGLLAFDRSAVNAVQKAERFPELQKLPSRLFENRFRQFRLLFKPEDLRY